MSLIRNKNKYFVILSITFVIFLFIILVTAIVFKFRSKDDNKEVTAISLNEDNLAITYQQGNKIKLSAISGEYKITITNTTEQRTYYTIQINNLVTSKDISVSIKDSLDQPINTLYKFDKINNLINLETIDGNTSITYTVIVNNIINNKVEFELKVINESNTQKTFSDLILINNPINEAKTKIGEESATTDEGLITTNDNDGISYYFRGNVTNNYLKIKDNLYRIVRINGDGTVRIVLDFSIENQYAYNTNTLAAGATTTSLLDLNSSSIKNALTEWYTANIYDYDQFFEEGKFCVEKSFDNMINNYSYTTVYDRIMVSHKPSLECSNEITLSKVGLLSIDEVVFAGASKQPNKKYYLYNKNIINGFLTNSVYSIDLDNYMTLMDVQADGSIGKGILITQPAYIRPVLNVNVNAKVKGTGTINDPYIIVA